MATRFEYMVLFKAGTTRKVLPIFSRMLEAQNSQCLRVWIPLPYAPRVAQLRLLLAVS